MIQKKLFLKCLLVVCASLFGAGGSAEANDAELARQLSHTYSKWRSAIVNKDARMWASVTAESRKLEIRNRIYSERKVFPQAVFELPAAPPSLAGLKLLDTSRRGVTANTVYYGNVDFGVGGTPVESVLLLQFLAEKGGWKYDKADYISLQALPDVRKALRAGDYSYVKQKDFQATGIAPKMPIPVGPAEYVAKVYVFCPGREVKMKVNKISDHRFQDTKAAEIVIGGGKRGLNEVQFATKSLEGSKGEEALAIRVYLLSSVEGSKPIKAFEYLVKEGESVKAFGSANFTIDAKMSTLLKGR